jgi:hypothetical protein
MVMLDAPFFTARRSIVPLGQARFAAGAAAV